MKKLKNQLKLMDRDALLTMLIDNLEENNNFIIQMRQWNNNEAAMRNGILTQEHYGIAKAQINSAINYYIDELSDQELEILAPLVSKSKTPPPPSKTASTEPQKQTILFFAANPSQQAELKLKDEFAVISQKLQNTQAYDLKSVFAGSTSEFVDAIDEYKPSIIHFSGHGEEGNDKQSELARKMNLDLSNGAGLIFHDRDKRGFQVLDTKSANALFRRLKRSNPQIKTVLLNACYSKPQAVAISKNKIYTIGSKISIEDEAAIEFSDGFYKKYATTQDVVQAVNYGITKATSIDFSSEENIFLFYNGEPVKLF